jgi:putative sugar O-methyltransferase
VSDSATASRSATATVEDWVAAMRVGMEDADEIYRPGEFWDELIDANMEMLRSGGVENLKRTVANNYFNWMVTALRDPQLQRAVRSWLEHPSLATLTNRLEEPASGLRVLDRRGAFSLSPLASWRYKLFVGATWERARRDDPFHLTERLSEPAVGNPLRIRHRGRLISQDLANSIIELSFVGRSGLLREGCHVAELGCGYGRLAHVYSEAFPLVYCVVDIPPALAVAQWYLTEVLGSERVVCYAPDRDFRQLEPLLKPGMIACLTPDQLELFPDGWFDCTQTISTLPEMPHEQAMHYLALVAAKSRAAVFLKQWRRWRNDADDTELTEADYRLPLPWRLVRRRVDPVQPAFFDQLWLR